MLLLTTRLIPPRENFVVPRQLSRGVTFSRNRTTGVQLPQRKRLVHPILRLVMLRPSTSCRIPRRKLCSEVAVSTLVPFRVLLQKLYSGFAASTRDIFWDRFLSCSNGQEV